MNRILSVVGLVFTCSVVLYGCSKAVDATPTLDGVVGTMSKQDVQIQAYIKSHNLSVVKDPSGLYYNVEAPGDSSFMTLTSIPTITYTRKNLSDSLLDASFGPTDFDGRQLKDHIAGWQVGLRKIGKGGTIFMIIPSPLGFGSEPVGNIIPANTILVCEVKLVDFR
jgi:FKBP-type peptidyl-prolyl cis-trans isomerase FkpA